MYIMSIRFQWYGKKTDSYISQLLGLVHLPPPVVLPMTLNYGKVMALRQEQYCSRIFIRATKDLTPPILLISAGLCILQLIILPAGGSCGKQMEQPPEQWW